MQAEYINTFIEGAESVIKMLCGIKVKHQEIYLRNSPILFNQVVIMIGIIGKVKGQVYFELSIDTAKKIASAMMGGISVLQLDEISKSAVSEMGNMIMGNVSTIFESKDMEIDITPPTFLTGEKIEVSNKLPNIVAPLELEGLGTMLVNVAAEEII